MQLKTFIKAGAVALASWAAPALAADISGKTIGVVLINGQSESLTEWSGQIVTAAAELGWEVIIKDGENNPAVVSTAIPEMLVQGVDGIITMAVDAPLISDGLTSAAEQGVPVIATEVGPGPAGIEMFTGVYALNDGDVGRMLGNYILEKDPDAVAVGQTIAIAAAARDAIAGAEEVLGDHLVEIADTDAANIVQSFTQTTIDLIQGNPEAKWFVTCCDFSPLMVLPALQSIQRDDVVLAGRIENVSTLQAMRAGSKVAIVANRPYYSLAALDAMAAYFADGTEIPSSRPDLTGDLKIIDNDNIPAEGRIYPFEDELAIYTAKWAEMYGN